MPAEPRPILLRAASAQIPTRHGNFLLCAYTGSPDGKEHLAFVLGDISGCPGVLARVHSECLTGDVFHSLRCDCGAQFDEALSQIGAAGAGILVYLRQEGRGIGLIDKLKAYQLQDEGYDTVQANEILGHAPDERDYGAAAAILADWQIGSVRLLTNNPSKIEGLEQLGVRVDERLPIEVAVRPENARYMATKAEKMRHILNGADLPFPAGKGPGVRAGLD